MRNFVTVFLLIIATNTVCAESFSISYKDGKVVRNFPEQTRPVIGLALSGGGARGIAHLGVIEALEEKGIRIERIAGTSMGSVVGGLYAAGYSSSYLIDSFRNTDWAGAISSSPSRRSTLVGQKNIRDWPLFELRFTGFKAKIPSSITSGQRFTTFLSWLCLEPTFSSKRNFDNLPIPFRSVTTDLNSGNRVVLSEGNLARAIQASSTVPLLFTPVPWGDMLLVDGGLTDYLPVSVARDMGSDFVIASLVEESMHKPKELDSILNIADQVTSIPTRNLTQLSKSNADYAITPDMSMFSSTDFSTIPDIIAQGKQAALQAIPALMDSLKNMTASYRKTFIEFLEVTPVSEETSVADIISSYITPGDSVSFGDIADALEACWSTGKYFSIDGKLDEKNKTLHVRLIPVPKTVVMHIGKGSGSADVDRTVDVVSESENAHDISEIITQVESITRKIKSEGLSLAYIASSQLDQSAGKLTIRVRVPYLTSIEIDENLTLKNSVIFRELDTETGSPFSINNVISSLENLYSTGLFEWTYADIETDGDGIRLKIHVREKKWVVARFGLHFDETNHTNARVTMTRENILGFGNQFEATMEASERTRLLMFESRSSRIYKSLYTYSIKAYKNYRLRFLYHDHGLSEDYGDDRYGAVFSIGQHMDNFGNVMFQFKSETLWITTGPKDKLEGNQKELRSVVMRSLIDSYDRYPFPQNGLLNLMYVETTSEVLGGTEQFVKLFWEGSMYKTFARKHTISGAFYLGSADPSTPDIESFTIGGTRSRLNCYDWESTGSHFYADFPGLADEEKTGNRLAALSIDYRLFIPRLFYLNLSYHIGNVWKNTGTITSRSLIQSFGIKGSLSTLVGPASVGWGITSEGDERIYMSAGWKF